MPRRFTTGKTYCLDHGPKCPPHAHPVEAVLEVTKVDTKAKTITVGCKDGRLGNTFNLVDRTGERYGRLVVQKRAANNGKHAAWWCKCDCGRTTVAMGTNLEQGQTQSCGCLRQETSHQQFKKMQETSRRANQYAFFKSKPIKK